MARSMVISGAIVVTLFAVATFAQRQYFQVRPSNVTVAQGDTAVLQCTIGNQAQQGQTHWTKDGGVLGFEDELEGYPRYRVKGDHAIGEYHLEISDARIEDDDEYECQAQPTGEAEDTGLRAKAYVDVLVPPNNITLEGTRNGALVEARKDVIFEVTCRVDGAKPAADVQWYKNGAPVPEHHYENRRVAQDEKRQSTISHLRWTAAKEDNGAVFTCYVVHPALPASRSLKTPFTLSVLYPPGVPVITGYEDGRILNADDFLQLKCSVENGNPPPEVVWYRNSVPVGRNATSSKGSTRNDYGFVVKSIDDETEYRCEASNLATVAPLSSSVRLRVYFPPEKVEISGPGEATVGDVIALQCKSSPSHPQAKIEWLIDGQPWNDHVQRNKPAATATGIESLSSIDLKISQMKPELTVVCTASNEHLPRTAKREIVAEKHIKVYYPPESVKITYNDEKPLMSGDTILLTCTATGGYPAAVLEWFRNEKRITSGATSKHGAGNSAISELTLTLSPHNNMEQIQCRAYNRASGSYRLTDTVALYVLFPPSFVRVSPDPPEFRAGSAADLVCESGSANPSPVVEWYREDELLPSIVAHNKTGPYGGWIVKKKLYLSPTVEDDGAIYECRAWSEVPGFTVVTQKVTLAVHYKPIFLAPSTHTLELLEGESISLNATALANPAVEQYVWTKDDVPSHILRSAPPRLMINGPMLDLVNIRRIDAGVYACRAKNRLGSANMTALVTVKYSPDIKHITAQTFAVAGDNVTLLCTVDAYPLDATSVWWETVEGGRLSPGGRYFETSSNGRGTLTIFGVRHEDTKKYVCKADNGIGNAAAETAVLVKQLPTFDKSVNFDRAAAEIGTEAIMRCVVDGVPAVTLTWHRDTGDQYAARNLHRLTADDRINISSVSDGLAKVTSDLRIKQVQSSDYGRYRCIADNEMGSNHADIVLGMPTLPDPPRDVRILNHDNGSVTISWKPGFDGGLPQRYRIWYSIGGGITKSPDSTFIVSDETTLTISNLYSQTKYAFFVQAFNREGPSSDVRTDIVETSSASGIYQDMVEEDIPILIIILLCLVGAFFLLLNAALVVCFIRRHRRKKLQDKATSARLGAEASNGRNIQMYSGSDGATGTTGASNGLQGGESAATSRRADSRYGNASDGEHTHRPQSAMSDDDTSIRTVIELDGAGHPIFNRPAASPRVARTMMRTAHDNAYGGTDYTATSPSGSYGEVIRSNSMQKHMLNDGMYSVPTTSYLDQSKNTYIPAHLSEELVPPSLGPLRSLSQEMNSYAAFSHYTPLSAVSSSNRHQHAPTRYSPPNSGQGGPISTVVHTNGRTPYAEVRPILTSQAPAITGQCDRNGGSPILSTFASASSNTPTNTKADYLDLDGLAGDLV